MKEDCTTELLQFMQDPVLPKIHSNNMMKWKEPWIGQRQNNNN